MYRRPRPPRGYDAAKRTVGRERVALVDAEGHRLAVAAVPASLQDRDAPEALDAGKARWPTLREWLSLVPEKVMFATDAYPYSDQMGWEEAGWMAARNGRQALAIALTGMMRDGEITRDRAQTLARMVLRENALRLYRLST